MLPDRVSNPGPLTYESGALPIALRGPALPPPVRPYQKEKQYPTHIFIFVCKIIESFRLIGLKLLLTCRIYKILGKGWMDG